MTSASTPTRVATLTIAKEGKKMNECPFCGAEFEVGEFDNLEDNGDHVVGTASITCHECGEVFSVRGFFHWDGEVEVM